MIRYAKIAGVNECIEKEILLDLGEIEIYGFLVDSPRELKFGDICTVLLEPSFIEGLDVKISAQNYTGVKRVDESFAYEVTGFLSNDKVVTECISFQDDAFRNLYGYLEGSCVSLTVDRINIMVLAVG